MKKYYLRLDDACERMDTKKWERLEKILDENRIKPLVGIIPNCEDPMMDKYMIDSDFWDKVHSWIKKGWIVAMHGYNHVYSTNNGGINPVNKRSEFAGESLDKQKEKIRKGISVFKKHEVNPKVFFAPSHTFDNNTLIALKTESDIRIISDTIAFDSYVYDDFLFVPQQSGKVRKLPFKKITFCYHPNTMTNKDFDELILFCKKHRFSEFSFDKTNRKKSLLDKLLSFIYFKIH